MTTNPTQAGDPQHPEALQPGSSAERANRGAPSASRRLRAVDMVLRIRLDERECSLDRLMEAVPAIGVRVLGAAPLGEPGVHVVSLRADDESAALDVQEKLETLVGANVEHIEDRVFNVHRGGKVAQRARVKVTSLADLERIYTPGVARVARAIQAVPSRARELTSIGNSVGIFTNGSRVLGLGDTGVLASMPVMEGKALLYAELAGVSATPILVDTRDPKLFADTVVTIASTFAAIHLEDIASPECFAIERELVDRVEKPVFHDDQHGTATAAVAAVLNACRLRGVPVERSTIGQIGAGAAGGAIAGLLLARGVGRVLVCDARADSTARLVEKGAIQASLSRVMSEADIVIAATGVPRLISPAAVRRGQVILPLSNPEPEILPELALDAGASHVADGGTVNNALAFPGLMRGLLDARAKRLTSAMMLGAARAIAELAAPGDLVPSILEPAVHLAVAAAVREEAAREG